MKTTQCSLILLAAVAVPVHAVTIPYFEDFESEPSCATNCTSVCVLSTSGWTNEPLLDDQDWLVDSGGTVSSQTGPAVDHTLGTSAGKYLYTEASSPCGSVLGSSILISPPLELTGSVDPRMEFHYHMYGANMGNLHVDVLDASQNLLQVDVIPPFSDNIDLWQSKLIDLTPFNSQTIHVRFRATHSGTGFLGDMAIDDVRLFEQPLPEDIFKDGFE